MVFTNKYQLELSNGRSTEALFIKTMRKLQKLKHQIQLATAYRWFLSVENDLDRMGMENPSVVFDVGAHLCQRTLHFRKSFPTASIHSFEPVDENFKKLKLNTKGKSRIEIN